MYESFFGFVNRPFLAAPSLDRYYPTNVIEQTVQTASRAIARAEGPVAIFGGTGLGKTLCCLRIAEHFRRSFEVVMLSSSPLVTRRALLQSLLFELRMPYRELNEGELRLTLMNRLQPSPEHSSDGVLLIVDEAQTLSYKLLDEIRLLTNVHRNSLPRVRLVLCGNMKLEEHLCNPQMESLNQRLATRCYLTPLSRQETASYVMHKIELCGVNHARVITPEALDALHRGSDGIPRLIDQLADQSMLIASQERICPVNADLVGKAWGMLQQLPNPWSEPESIAKPPKTPISVSGSQSEGLPTPPKSDVPSTEKRMTIRESQFPLVSEVTTPTIPLPSKTHSMAKGVVPTKVGQAPTAPSPDLAASKDIPPTLQTVDVAMHGSKDPAMENFAEPSKSDSRRAFERLLESTRVRSAQTQSSSIIEFGDLEDTEPAAAEAESMVQNSNAANANQLCDDPFGSDFDEEFSLPVQSSDGYQSYSGIAFGNLNYDLEKPSRSFETAAYEVEEADAFLEPLPIVHNENADAGTQYFSNITASQAASLERQVEEEMRELVSELNLSAMSFDPTQIIVELEPSDSAEAMDSHGEVGTFHEHSLAGSFAEMRDEWNEGNVFAEASRPIASDDRDMLVVEEDMETIKTAVHSAAESSHRPVLHPYAKLFTNLRNT